MTVIAYRNGVMAGDGRVTVKDWIDNDDTRKVRKLGDGSICGAAGSNNQCLVFYKLMEEAAKEEDKTLPDLKLKNIEALLVGPDKLIWFWGGVCWEKITLPYYAVGSGYRIANTAMDAGASAKKAVEIVCKRVTSCGGKITTVKL